MPITTFLDPEHYPSRNLRGLQLLALRGTLTVQTRTVVSDTGGGGTSVWSNSGTFPCRIDSMGGSPRVIASRLSEASTDVVTMPTSGTVGTDNRVVVANRGTFEVTAVQWRDGQLVKRFEVAPI